MRKIKIHPALATVLICGVVGIAIGLTAAVLCSKRDTVSQPMVELGEAQPVTVPAETLSAAEILEPDPLLTLANPWNPVPEDWAPVLADLGEGQSVDERCCEALLAMLEACRLAGMEPVVVSSYRSQEKQQALYDNKVMRVMAEGFEREEALVKAAMEVAVPGTSEHQLGLAVDIVHDGNWNLDESQEDTPTQQWLMEHSWEYGFVLRYPNQKSAVTGIIYEPWHYRYVGRDHAKTMHQLGMCLEEYLDYLKV